MTDGPFRALDETMWVAPQLTPADLVAAAAAGVTLVVNNRPDGEAPDEPQGPEMAAAAAAAGLRYVAIPVGHAGFSAPQVEAMASAIEGAGGRVLAYCRSGTRSTLLWSLARASRGEAFAALQAKARGAGYDLSPVAPMIDMLARQSSE